MVGAVESSTRAVAHHVDEAVCFGSNFAANHGPGLKCVTLIVSVEKLSTCQNNL